MGTTGGTRVLPWTKTKTRRDRSIPISSRLKGILALRGVDPAGQPMSATSYVFGNEIGQRVKSVSRAWNRAVLKAHGYEPSYAGDEPDGGIPCRPGLDRSALSRSAAGSGLPLAGVRHAAPHRPGLAGAYVDRADEHLLGEYDEDTI